MLWYKDAVIYELHVRAYCDSNRDGIGDFAGLIDKLDYLQDLGITALWLLPFYPSPMRDDGYDIADYRQVHPDYGTRADFRRLVREAHRRGLKIIAELVINHTSERHPWFQAARRAPAASRKRDFYVWSQSDERYAGTRIIFSDTEHSNWTWDDVAKAYYWHRFFSHQPDLNFDNPAVRRAVVGIMRFWLDQGVDGLRLDAIPYLCERDGTSNENLPETHAVVREFRAVIDAHYRNRMLLAEANQWPEDVRDYFSAGDECHMAYHFPLMPRMYMAIAQEDRHPIIEILQQTPDIPESCQWAIFLRNHDELTLEMVTSRERDYMYQAYAADPLTRLNLGIRRRLAPLMDNDPDRIKLMNAMLLSLPGAPIIYYGDEIGMGDNIYLGDRNGVRTPMQWSPDRNAGFSSADPQRLYLPPIMDPVYGYAAVNVEAQTRDASSLLNWMRRMLAVRKGHLAFGRGSLSFLRPNNRKILAYVREYDDELILCVINLARTAQPVELDLRRFKTRVPVELTGRTVFPAIGELPYLLTMPGHAFFWLQLLSSSELAPHEVAPTPELTPVLVLFDGWHSLFRERVQPWRMAMADKLRAQLECEALPRHVAQQVWNAAHGGQRRPLRLVDYVLWGGDSAGWLLALWRPVDVAAGTPDDDCPEVVAEDAAAMLPGIFFPLALHWPKDDEEVRHRLQAATVARVRRHAELGLLIDACADSGFCRALLQAIADGLDLRCRHGAIGFSATAAFATLADEALPALPVRAPDALNNATTVAFGQRLFLKLIRRLHGGVRQEFALGRYLTDVAHFAHCPPVFGALDYRSDAGPALTLALLQGYVENQGDAWTYTRDYLARFVEQQPGPDPALSAAGAGHGAYLALLATLGRRTAELHRALARPSDDPEFAPEARTTAECAAWVDELRAQARATLDLLLQRLAVLTPSAQAEAQRLLDRRDSVLDAIDVGGHTGAPGLTMRVHGDFGLDKALLAQNDWVIINCGGKSPAGAPLKQSPLHDVAGMLRSIAAVAQTALQRPDGIDDQSGRAAMIDAWRVDAATTFVRAYGESAADLLGSDTAATRRALDLFQLRQELAHLDVELRAVSDPSAPPHADRVAASVRAVATLCAGIVANASV